MTEQTEQTEQMEQMEQMEQTEQQTEQLEQPSRAQETLPVAAHVIGRQNNRTRSNASMTLPG